jgi:hypothetical protein
MSTRSLLKALPRKSIPIVDELTIYLRDLSNNGGIISEFAITRLVAIITIWTYNFKSNTEYNFKLYARAHWQPVQLLKYW